MHGHGLVASLHDRRHAMPPLVVANHEVSVQDVVVVVHRVVFQIDEEDGRAEGDTLVQRLVPRLDLVLLRLGLGQRRVEAQELAGAHPDDEPQVVDVLVVRGGSSA